MCELPVPWAGAQGCEDLARPEAGSSPWQAGMPLRPQAVRLSVLSRRGPTASAVPTHIGADISGRRSAAGS